MCNLYTEPAQLDLFGFKDDEIPPLPEGKGRTHGPLGKGLIIRDTLIVRPGRLDRAQWGLIPWFSKTRIPVNKDGKKLSTNNCRVETMETAASYKAPWMHGQRCLIPVESFEEPYWGPWEEPFKKSVRWQFARADGTPWALAGLWSEWHDKETDERVLSYTMVTQNCDSHPLLSLMHKHDKKLPRDQQDRRAVVPIEKADWDTWLSGSNEDAKALIQLPPVELFRHGPADPNVKMTLPI